MMPAPQGWNSLPALPVHGCWHREDGSSSQQQSSMDAGSVGLELIARLTCPLMLAPRGWKLQPAAYVHLCRHREAGTHCQPSWPIDAGTTRLEPTASSIRPLMQVPQGSNLLPASSAHRCWHSPALSSDAGTMILEPTANNPVRRCRHHETGPHWKKQLHADAGTSRLELTSRSLP